MPANVPTNEEFEALAERVTALENAAPSLPAEPEPADSVIARWTPTGLVVDAQFGVYRGPVTLRASSSPLTGQTGWYKTADTDSLGLVSLDITSFTNTNSRYWQLEGAAGSTVSSGRILAEGVAQAVTAPPPAPELPAPIQPGTGGSGGPMTDRLNQTYGAFGMVSTTHVFAAGLNPNKPLGLCVYMDGSGAHGLKNPNQPYLLDADGTAGLVAVAKKHNMVLVTPTAPPPSDSDGDNCWYNTSSTPNATAKSDWLRALIDSIYLDYNIDKSRVAIGGYSSGAQGTTRWFIPRHGAEIMTDGVFVAIGCGGAPYVTPRWTQAFKDAVVGYWNTGQNDQFLNPAGYGSKAGVVAYTVAGFDVRTDWPAGVGHSRSDFARIMDAQITAHVRPA